MISYTCSIGDQLWLMLLSRPGLPFGCIQFALAVICACLIFIGLTRVFKFRTFVWSLKHFLFKFCCQSQNCSTWDLFNNQGSTVCVCVYVCVYIYIYKSTSLPLISFNVCVEIKKKKTLIKYHFEIHLPTYSFWDIYIYRYIPPSSPRPRSQRWLYLLW